MEEFHSMSRRDLQTLCKKHHIPANSTNSLMAERLAMLFTKGHEDLRPLGPSCLKGSGGSGSQDDGHCTRSKRKRVTFMLPEGDPDVNGTSDRSDPVVKNSPELPSTVPVSRRTKSRASRLQGDAGTAIPGPDVRSTRRGTGARALKHHNVNMSHANAAEEDSGNCADDEGLVVGTRSLRHRVVVTAVDEAPRRSRRRRDPGLTEEVTAAAAAAPVAVAVPEVPKSSEVGGRRGSRKHRQDPVLSVSTSSQESVPAAETVARDESDRGGPRRSKRNHRTPEGAMAVRGAPEISVSEIPEVGVEVEKEGAAQNLKCQRPSRRKSVRFRNKELQDGVQTVVTGNKLQRQTRNSASETADEGSSAPTSVGENCRGAPGIDKKSEEVTQVGEPLRRSKRNALDRNKLVSDILLTEGGKSDDGKVAESLLLNKPKIQELKRGAPKGRENGKKTEYSGVQANHIKVSDYDEPSKRKRRKSVKWAVAEQKVFLPPIGKPEDDKSLVQSKRFRGTKNQSLDKEAPKIFPSSDKTSDENKVLENPEESAELSQLGETPKESKYQSSKDTSDPTKQEKMDGDLLQNGNSGLCPQEQSLETDAPPEEPKTSGEPDKRGIKHEVDWSKEDGKKLDSQNFEEDWKVSCSVSPAVNHKSYDLCDQTEIGNLPGLPASIMKEIVENSHANKKGSVRKTCDGEGQSSFKGSSSKKVPHGYHCYEEDGGPNEEPDYSKLNEHVINGADAKAFTDLMEVQSSPDIRGPSSVSAGYNQGLESALEITPVGVGDDDALSLPDICDEGRGADIAKSPLVHYQGILDTLAGSESHDDLSSNLHMENKDEEVPGEAIAAMFSAQSFKTEGKSPGSDGTHGSSFSTQNLSHVLDDQGSELHGGSLPVSLMQSGDEELSDEAVVATLSRTRSLQEERKSPASGGCHPNRLEVDFGIADDPSDAHVFSNASKMRQDQFDDVATKENMEVDLEGNFGAQNLSLNEESAELLGMTVGRQTNEEPSSYLMNNSKGDATPLEEAVAPLSACRSVATASNSTGGRHLHGLIEGGAYTQTEPLDRKNAPEVFNEDRSSSKRLGGGLWIDSNDESVSKKINEASAGEHSAIRFTDTILFSAGKRLSLNEDGETMDRADVLDDVKLVNETAEQTKNKEPVEGAVSFNGSLETYLNNHVEPVEAIPDAHNGVMLGDKVADPIANTEEMEGEVASDSAANLIGHNEIAMPSVCDLDREIEPRNEKLLITQEAGDGSLVTSPVKDTASEDQCGLALPLHSPACEIGAESADEQETEGSTERLDMVVVTQTDKEPSSSRRTCSQLVTVPSNFSMSSLSVYQPLSETHNVANNGDLVGDSVVESQHVFPDHAGEEFVEDRTSEQLLENQIVCNNEFSQDNEYYPINVEETSHSDSYGTKQPCEVGLIEHGKTMELIKDALDSEEMLATKAAQRMENRVAEPQTEYRNTLDLDKEKEAAGVQLGHIHPFSAVKAPKLIDYAQSDWEGLETTDKLVGGTDPDDQCITLRVNGPSFQDSKPHHDESVILSRCPIDGAIMNLCANSPELSFVDIGSDVCELAAMGPRLSCGDRDNDGLLEFSLVSDVNSTENLESPITQAIRPGSSTNKSGSQAKKGTVENNSNDVTSSEFLETENSIGGHDSIDHGGNEMEDDKPNRDESGHYSSDETCLEVLQTEKSTSGHDFTAHVGNEKEDDKPERHVLVRNLSHETSSEVLGTENPVGGCDFVAYGWNEKEDDKADMDVLENMKCSEVLRAENSVCDYGSIDQGEVEKEDDEPNRYVSELNSGYETCSDVLQTENLVGGHGKNEKEDVEQNRDVSENKSSYETYSEVLQTEIVDHGEDEKEDRKPNSDLPERELSSEEESLKEEGDNADDKLEVGIPEELVLVEHNVDELKGQRSGEMSRNTCQTNVYGATNLIAENDSKEHGELEQEENRPDLGLLSEEKLDHNAEYGCSLEQNEKTVEEKGLAECIQPENQVDESWGGAFNSSLKQDTRSDAEDAAMMFAEQLDNYRKEDASSNKQSSTSDHHYFAHIEGAAFESLEGTQITNTQPDTEANLEQVLGSWDLEDTVKDINHEKEAGMTQDQDAGEIRTEEPEIWRQREDLDYVTGYDNTQPDTEANLEQVLGSWDLEDTIKDINHEKEAGMTQDQDAGEIRTEEPEIRRQREDLDYVTGYDNSLCQDTKDEQTYVTKHEATESYSVEVHNLEDILELEATKNTKSSNGREDYVGQETGDYCASLPYVGQETGDHWSGDKHEGLSISKLTDPHTEKHQEFIVDADLDAGINVDEEEQTLFPMNSTSDKVMEECGSVYDKPLSIGKAENGALINHFGCEELSDGRKQSLSVLDFAYKVRSEGAIGCLVKHIALDGTQDNDNHPGLKEESVIVAKDTDSQNLHDVEEKGDSRKDSTANGFASGDYSSCQLPDTVGSLAGEEGISDVFSGMQISSAKKHTNFGRISCTPQRNLSSRDLQIENMKNTPYSKKLHASNMAVEKSTIPTSKRRALADLQNRIHRD